ncbi:MAG TPA: hypothetical protein VET48_04950 [Steroidobacteraceae bacterium]|nr:hypothetical protein [Steroidobacteraceae bacterium]
MHKKYFDAKVGGCKNTWHAVDTESDAGQQVHDVPDFLQAEKIWSGMSLARRKNLVKRMGFGQIYADYMFRDFQPHSQVDLAKELLGDKEPQVPNERVGIVHTIDRNKECSPTWCEDLDSFCWPPNRDMCDACPVCHSTDRNRAGDGRGLRYCDNEWHALGAVHIACHEYDEVHAYDVLHTLGRYGHEEDFFALFAEIWRCLKYSGLLFVSVPSWNSLKGVSDPGAARTFTSFSLLYLVRKKLSESERRHYLPLLVGDWEIVDQSDDGKSFNFILRAK